MSQSQFITNILYTNMKNANRMRKLQRPKINDIFNFETIKSPEELAKLNLIQISHTDFHYHEDDGYHKQYLVDYMQTQSPIQKRKKSIDQSFSSRKLNLAYQIETRIKTTQKRRKNYSALDYIAKSKNRQKSYEQLCKTYQIIQKSPLSLTSYLISGETQLRKNSCSKSGKNIFCQYINRRKRTQSRLKRLRHQNKTQNNEEFKFTNSYIKQFSPSKFALRPPLKKSDSTVGKSLKIKQIVKNN